MDRARFVYRLFVLIALTIALAGCEMPSSVGGTNVWIDVPLDGLSIAEGQSINIEGHASSPQGIARVEIWINGEMTFEVVDPPAMGNLNAFSQTWTPPGPGDYTIQVVAFSGDGSPSEPDVARVRVGAPLAEEQPQPAEESPPQAEPDTPTSTPTATATATVTPMPPVEVVSCPPTATALQNANCRSGPGTAYEVIASFLEGQSATVAGRSADGVWWVIESPGSSGTCWVWGELIQLSTDTCEVAVWPAPPLPPTDTPTPTFTPVPPPADTTPPPAPAPAVPANSLELSCRGSQNLAWLPVDDPSGIAEYQIQVQRHAGDNNWQAAAGGSQTGIHDKQITVPVECGWYYRWRVRAVDGAGNVGEWSGWSLFTVTLE